jgi:enoyl-CoA hydratase/carnithine racemase
VAGSIDSSLADICDRVEACPTAAVTLVHALRSGPVKTVDEGLLVESLAYSTLQSGPEFRTWLDGRRAPSRSEPDGEVVLAERRAGRLAITLNRPGVHNAYNAAMRDALARILALAAVDETIASIDLGGAGPSFCSGGDLDEFGSFPDPATAHLIRTGRSPAHLISLLSTKVTSRLHGWCVGSGIELPAFGARVVAAPDTRIRLPELEMGLIPGAGGTVSIPARIGRQRTAWLALTGRTISAETALAWGLADEIEAGA